MENSERYPFISVIIPVFNNIEGLEKCLKALNDQNYPRTFYEILVIDNGSTEDVKKVTDAFESVILGYEDIPGSYVARNKGITLAKGEILAFTDSDCIPDKSWLSEGVAKLQATQNCGLVGGKIEIFFRNPEHLNFVELYDIDYLNQEKHVKRENYAATGNMFTFSEIFKKVGKFDKKLKSCGDKEWGQRVNSRGFLVAFAEDSIVRHPSRSSIFEFYNKKIRCVGGKYDYDFGYSMKTDVYDLKRDIKLLKEIIRHLVFLKELTYYLNSSHDSPRLRFPDKQVQGIHEKFAFILLGLFMNYAIALEFIRLRVGGSTRR